MKIRELTFNKNIYRYLLKIIVNYLLKYKIELFLQFNKYKLYLTMEINANKIIRKNKNIYIFRIK